MGLHMPSPVFKESLEASKPQPFGTPEADFGKGTNLHSGLPARVVWHPTLDWGFLGS